MTYVYMYVCVYVHCTLGRMPRDGSSHPCVYLRTNSAVFMHKKISILGLVIMYLHHVNVVTDKLNCAKVKVVTCLSLRSIAINAVLFLSCD